MERVYEKYVKEHNLTWSERSKLVVLEEEITGLMMTTFVIGFLTFMATSANIIWSSKLTMFLNIIVVPIFLFALYCTNSKMKDWKLTLLAYANKYRREEGKEPAKRIKELVQEK